MRTQSKYAKDRKSGGLRTLHNCFQCNLLTKGIWETGGKSYCYKCYKNILKK